jgi:hypothetical protein
MTQKEFISLSKQKVKSLNGGTEEAEEAWRSGYLFLINQLDEWINTLDNPNFVDTIDCLVDDSRYLEEFE